MAKQGFSKASRLLGPSQYSTVFQKADFKLSAATMLLLVKKSVLPPRLGVIVAKKNVKSAVQRNRLKRIIRESFRLRQEEFGTIDLVFLARRGLDKMNNQEASIQINKLFDELINKLNRSK
ncbi:MAG: ribonuclease P protein component [SAR86 cluster bacterium]|uniref:Ribonuclease P protein component n=1 Tax=SAR86 cluster bacterium TaxID=2030880 RepID=A0A2A5CJ70_9GAMM|nr:MAG: ribonuclease P protein component [SAR86 cluster bacterium]